MTPLALRSTLAAAALLAALALPATAPAAPPPAVSVAPGRIVATVDGGAVRNDVDAGGASFALALPDGSSLLFGANPGVPKTLYVAKIGANGQLVGSFGAGGVATVAAPGNLLQVLLQPDGKILLVSANQSGIGPNALRVTRLNADATLDRAFGIDGAATTGVNEGCGACTTAALQPDGAIVLTGTTGTVQPPPAPLNLHWAVTRLTPAGQVDQGFGASGIATIPTAISASGFNVAIGRGGTIVTEAQAQASLVGPASSLLLARLTPGGALDPAFAGGRPVEVPFATGFLMLVQGDDKIVVNGQGAGSSVPSPTPRRQLLARYTAAGAPDATFGTGGLADLGSAVEPSQLLGGPAGSLLVAGTPAFALAPGQGPIRGRLNVRLLTPSGTVDPALGGGPEGRTVDIPFGGGGSSFLVSVRPRPVGSLFQNSFRPNQVVPRPDGSYLLPGGVAVTQPTGEGAGFSIGRFAAAALTPAFALDPAFGGPAEPLRLSVRLPRQRAATARVRHGIRIVLKASAVGLAHVRITHRGRAIANSLLPVFTTAAHTVPVELTSYGNRYLRHHRGLRVSVTASARDLLTATARARTQGRLR